MLDEHNSLLKLGDWCGRQQWLWSFQCCHFFIDSMIQNSEIKGQWAKGGWLGVTCVKANWSLVTSSLIQRLLITSVLFNIVTNNQDDGMECALRIFTWEKWLINQVAAMPWSGILRGCWSVPVGISRHEWKKIDAKPYLWGGMKFQAHPWTGWGLTDWKAALEKRLQGSWWTPGGMWATDLPLWQTQPAVAILC